jgi:peptidoglycan hydrolase-like protein with peptidoglycan-binding domain
LNGHGAKLAVDGKWGKDTREAIKAFQKENGLKATGYANKKTRVKLGLKF